MNFSLDLCRHARRILLVDDDLTVLDVTKRMLEHLGYQTTPVSSPLDALDLFRKDPSRFDLVITDMSMPRMTGDTLARNIMETRPGTPVILHSAICERITREQARETGIREIVAKPSGMRELARAINLVLDEGLPQKTGARR